MLVMVRFAVGTEHGGVGTARFAATHCTAAEFVLYSRKFCPEWRFRDAGAYTGSGATSVGSRQCERPRVRPGTELQQR